eukprot:6271883-Alexandrium_andersonii.AAC.1
MVYHEIPRRLVCPTPKYAARAHNLQARYLSDRAGRPAVSNTSLFGIGQTPAAVAPYVAGARTALLTQD